MSNPIQRVGKLWAFVRTPDGIGYLSLRQWQAANPELEEVCL